MKKTGILNSDITRVISLMGHTDRIVICDAGLPIPNGVERIDLAVKAGLPSFQEVLEVVLSEMEVEKAYRAIEMEEVSPGLKEELEKTLGGIETVTISHERFKELCQEAKAVIRTGECTPYANVILQAGVIF
ncbi:D-ribose pyranase [Kroppenstedtia pulmonis]|uniref:D-ribose pyranase n=1 Tax=Kroppenstedtia pulmonis TaxID=1380685 RepID=A0A7D3XHP7_9BACL|nr:D-ribose pyranase [Kroppenstedtia pulmonis]QKG83824.1 D-ribose pyranase [Kroppenstedtia pulmonis]